MIQDINEADINKIIQGYDHRLEIEDYKSPDPADGHFGYGLTGKFDIDVILRLLKATNSRDIFEFGTWLGRTTRILALNLDHVYTIDIPQEDAIEVGFQKHQQFNEIPPRDWIGFASMEMDNVTQFYGDAGLVSVMNDVKSSIGRELDSCFIDYDHSYLYTLSATMQAIDMVKGGGIIIWHDIKVDHAIGVSDALSILPFTVYHILNTWVGFYINNIGGNGIEVSSSC